MPPLMSEMRARTRAYGQLFRGGQTSWLWTDIHPDDFALEAWERMTWGGWWCSPLETHRTEIQAQIAHDLNTKTPLQIWLDKQ